MDRIALLNALPFLSKVTLEREGPSIWKQHLDVISQHLSGKDGNSENNLFPCHGLSIEPIAHHCGETAGVAFFATNTNHGVSFNNSNSIISTEEGEPRLSDPGLVEFKAFLLSAHHQRFSEDDMNTPQRKPKPKLSSPALSSASTAMSNSQTPRTPKAGRAHYVADGETAAVPNETFVLYFVVDHETYCVDHCQIRSIEVEEPPKPLAAEQDSNFGSNGIEKPMSLLLTFDSCTFRVFHDNVISNTEEKSKEYQAQIFQNCFLKLKTFMVSEGSKLAEFRSSSDSFISYLGDLSIGSPADDCGESSLESHPENGQTSIPEHSMNGSNSDTHHEVLNGADCQWLDTTRSISSCLNSYHNSWKSLQSLHSLIKIHKQRKVANTLDQDDSLFVMLANRSAQECMKSYVESDVVTAQEERLGGEGLAKIQESIDDLVQNVFPAKKHNSSTPNKLHVFEQNKDLASRVKEDLTKYKELVKVKHRSMGFLPKR